MHSLRLRQVAPSEFQPCAEWLLLEKWGRFEDGINIQKFKMAGDGGSYQLASDQARKGALPLEIHRQRETMHRSDGMANLRNLRGVHLHCEIRRSIPDCSQGAQRR